VEKDLPDDLFDEIQLCALHNMIDVFERLKLHSSEARDFVRTLNQRNSFGF